MAPSISCEHLSEQSCLLGLFGGLPYPRNCAACLAAGENTPEYAATLFATRSLTHPPARPRVSGCCDSALNP